MLKKISLIVFVVFVAISCSTDDDISSPVPVPEMVEKNVEFQVYTERSFSERRFDEAFVKVEIFLLKDKLGGGDQTVLFQKTLDWMHVRDFPKETNKLIEQQKVVYDKKSEITYVSYGLYFNVNGARSSEGTGFSLSPGNETEYVRIKI